MIVVIPAYQPDEKLIQTVAELRQKTDYPIVIVNDGSSEDRAEIFSRLEPEATVLHHEVNCGKGRAMKTAFAYIHEHYASTEGVVTVDADGQHLVPDIVSVSEEWAAHRIAPMIIAQALGLTHWKAAAARTPIGFALVAAS